MDQHNFEVIELKNRGGSVEHFYHFFFGALVPLVNHLLADDHKELYFMRSCGPMNRLLLELGMENLILVDKATLPCLIHLFGKTTLEGYDGDRYYDQSVFLKIRDFLLHRLGSDDLDTLEEPSAEIVLINRGKSDPFYDSSECELQTSANQRRSIPNFDVLAAAVRDACINANVFGLESSSLKQQARLFFNSRVFVAQHGGALANVFWMRPKTTLIEIVPPPHYSKSPVQFKNSCAVMGVEYEPISQQSAHAPVNVQAVLAAILGHPSKQCNAFRSERRVNLSLIPSSTVGLRLRVWKGARDASRQLMRGSGQ
jgi:Glycosyltransferase 61